MSRRKSFYNPLLLFMIGFVSTGQMNAQTTLAGKIVDSYLQIPLKGVTVKAGDKNALTDEKGRFQVDVGDQTSEILLSREGYQSISIPVKGWKGEKTITLKPSSLTLPEVVVQAYGTDQKLLETSGGFSLLTEKDLDRGDRVNLAPVLNTLAGVRVDQAYMDNSRISLRGEGLRSNYGIRNVGIYVDGIPLNEADGFARLEGLGPRHPGRGPGRQGAGLEPLRGGGGWGRLVQYSASRGQ